ncbi:MAG: DUF4395 domain-containing protein [Leptonema sp. (in: Bacteria)]|nr:DUF4395 domain-containing protein [Leptonema sp. (in: bacteria)]
MKTVISVLTPDFPTVVIRQISRLTAIQISILALSGAIFNSVWLIPLWLVFEFSIRFFLGPKKSVMVLLSKQIFDYSISHFGSLAELKSIRPTRFAWFCGLSFSILGLIGAVTSLPLLTSISLSTLAVFSFLEASFGFCFACYLFGWAEHFGWISPDVCIDCKR